MNNIKVFCFAEWQKKQKYFCTLLLFVSGMFISTNGYCINKSTKQDYKIIYDSSIIKVREPDLAIQNALLNNTDYKYDRIGPAPKSLWERFTNWFWRKVSELLGSKGGVIGFQIFEYLLIATALVLIIVLLLKNNVRALFYGKSAAISVDFKEFEEDIHKINFNELIAAALSEKDFRRAVRLHFLKLLKELTDKNLIIWKIDKTNNDYSVELANSRYSEHFRKLALSYEYIWYGNFQPDEKTFNNTIERFNLFNI